jgi:hypothetical protein
LEAFFASNFRPGGSVLVSLSFWVFKFRSIFMLQQRDTKDTFWLVPGSWFLLVQPQQAQTERDSISNILSRFKVAEKKICRLSHHYHLRTWNVSFFIF